MATNQKLTFGFRNLCSEIVLPTNEERTAVCCLSSVNLEHFDKWKKNKQFIDDLITIEESFEIIENKKKNIKEQTDNIINEGFPSYTTAAGWLGYSDEKIKKLCKEAKSDGFGNFINSFLVTLFTLSSVH